MSSRKELANAIRALSMDAVQKAKSGHPGAPMGMADIAEVLWRDFLKHNPQNPSWADRDRFVLSNGHGSMLIYSLLHLTGYDLPMEELKNFRQLHSKTPGRSKSRLKSMLSGMRKKQARRKNPHGTRNSLLTRKLIRRKPLNLPAV